MCQSCNATFGVLKHKHHCRFCFASGLQDNPSEHFYDQVFVYTIKPSIFCYSTTHRSAHMYRLGFNEVLLGIFQWTYITFYRLCGDIYCKNCLFRSVEVSENCKIHAAILHSALCGFTQVIFVSVELNFRP